jgi:hypothetical protein
MPSKDDTDVSLNGSIPECHFVKITHFVYAFLPVAVCAMFGSINCSCVFCVLRHVIGSQMVHVLKQALPLRHEVTADACMYGPSCYKLVQKFRYNFDLTARWAGGR